MFSTAVQKLRFLYKPYALAIVSVGYVLGELGHYVIGVTSKATAEDLHYGDISCQLNSSTLSLIELPIRCEQAQNETYDHRTSKNIYNILNLPICALKLSHKKESDSI
ncbi:hypothetical protein HZH68_002649 [Vespula germanica]|uniref:Uncharacterized protein n=1 Tax=Vespula germanica TaxID=30212 RepID=A0A834NMR6_VESGE|nr:hypothetical protein HZH68_002649 [Vespula germanica]